VLLACAAALLVSASGASAQVFYPADRYDCVSYQAGTGHTVYVDSYQFQSGQRYAVGFRKAGAKTGLGKQFGHGTYKLSGKKIVSTSGYLTSHHEYLLIETNDLAIVKNNGAFQSIGCYDTRQHSTGGGGSSTFLGGAASATYTCYETEFFGGVYSLDPPYSRPLTFYSDGTYQWNYSVRSASAWHQNADSIVFSAGPFWGTYAHDVGTWHPSGGVTMPHAPASVSGLTYSLVIKDTVAEGGTPPSVEYSSTDGPGGSSSIPMSFLYCKK
jgi:hypothetical protein